jgi:hypothetical protein
VQDAVFRLFRQNIRHFCGDLCGRRSHHSGIVAPCRFGGTRSVASAVLQPPRKLPAPAPVRLFGTPLVLLRTQPLNQPPFPAGTPEVGPCQRRHVRHPLLAILVRLGKEPVCPRLPRQGRTLAHFDNMILRTDIQRLSTQSSELRAARDPMDELFNVSSRVDARGGSRTVEHPTAKTAFQ